ncbi:recombination protein RecT [Orbus hercynius]|uniref:Recombination protein RecT n=1 Tax=Orbus hercynius TaxID=593135 RepID=A0A495RIF8_9GAMM|nr:recombinase RecT [Orbus hercynius]RKS87297.1 recombination protein RecT [Orbus hercynius]
MTTQSTAVSTNIKSFFDKPAVKAKLTELLHKNAASFTTSVLQIVNSNEMLAKADPMSIFNAACMAATLNLPINNSLGFAYIVPYNNKKKEEVNGKKIEKWVTEAQFQIGYKGFIQLAQRSGQFERLVSIPVYEKQLAKKDLINGFVFDWDGEYSDDEKPIGYYAYFKLINGFSAELYMSEADVIKHAGKYSQTFKKGFGNWKDNFEAMALKTVTKLLLSKQAPLSIEMQKAVMSDQSVIKDITNDSYDYIDNDSEPQAITLIQVDDELFKQIQENVLTGELELSDALNSYSFTEEQIKQLGG